MAYKRSEPLAPTERFYMPCAVPDCEVGATIRIRDGKVKSDYCLRHYERRISRDAKAYCDERGLTTREKQLAFIRERISQPLVWLKPGRALPRVPGEDDA